MLVPNTCEYSVWNFPHVTLLALENFKVAPGFFKNLCTPVQDLKKPHYSSSWKFLWFTCW